jgi:hypothetical protein
VRNGVGGGLVEVGEVELEAAATDEPCQRRKVDTPLVYYARKGRIVTPDFPKKTKCMSYVRQDQVYTHMMDVMSEISINSNKNVQELNHYIISLLHSDV